MIHQAPTFRESIDGVRLGNPAAAWQLVEEYGPHIQRVVRRKLDRQMRAKFDSIDFVQMVWTSFFEHPSQIVRFETPDQLVQFLTTMARNKVVSEFRRWHGTQKHDVDREKPLEDTERDSVNEKNPTPSQIAIAHERFDKLMDEQSERNRSIVNLRIGGETYEAIGRKLGIHERTARKVIDEMLGS